MTQLQTIVLKVSIDCDACKRKVKKALDGVEGVHTIDVDMKQEKVTVTGHVEAKSLVKKLAKVGKKAVVSSNQAGHAYIVENSTITEENPTDTRNKKGGGKKGNLSRAKVAATFDDSNVHTEGYAHWFSDENANSCSVM